MFGHDVRFYIFICTNYYMTLKKLVFLFMNLYRTK